MENLTVEQELKEIKTETVCLTATKYIRTDISVHNLTSTEMQQILEQTQKMTKKQNQKRIRLLDNEGNKRMLVEVTIGTISISFFGDVV